MTFKVYESFRSIGKNARSLDINSLEFVRVYRLVSIELTQQNKNNWWLQRTKCTKCKIIQTYVNTIMLNEIEQTDLLPNIDFITVLCVFGLLSVVKIYDNLR